MTAHDRVVREAAAQAGAELTAFPEVLPFATPPRDVTCRQGAHTYRARQLASRLGLILFRDPVTGQLGIARSVEGEGIDARQYPHANAAVIMFLGSFDAIDAD